MKNVVFASLLGTLTGAFAIPHFGGPVHYQLTRPYSMFGYIPNATSGPSSVTLGIAPLDFIVTDVMISRDHFKEVLILVNGAPMMNLGGHPPVSGSSEGHCTMNSGVFIPAGSTVAVRVSEPMVGGAGQYAVTLAGYVQ